MQTDHNKHDDREASVSRRTFFQIAAAGTVAAFPVAAEAAVAEKTSRLPQLTPEQQLEACISQLRNILQQIRPNVVDQFHSLLKGPDGSYEFCLSGRPAYEDFSGDGFYEISLEGWPSVWYLKEAWRHRLDGTRIEHSRHLLGLNYEDGEPVGDYWRRFSCSVNVLRKLEGCAA